MSSEQKTSYLGDGLYVSHDGFQYWLIANDPLSDQRVALEPGVLSAFLRYIEVTANVMITVEPTSEQKADN